MSGLIDLTGRTFGRLLVVARSGSKGKQITWLCRCRCGAEITTPGYHLREGWTSSCGCLRSERLVALSTTHGLCKPHPAEYRIWKGIKQRCFNTRRREFASYGARGISMCAEWRDSFSEFLAYVGPRPSSGHSLDRIDGARGYEPGNVRWATQGVQGQNRRGVRLSTDAAKDIRRMLASGARGIDVAAHFGVSKSAISHVASGRAWRDLT